MVMAKRLTDRYVYSDEIMREAAENATVADALRHLGHSRFSGSLYTWFRLRCEQSNIDISHMPRGSGHPE